VDKTLGPRTWGISPNTWSRDTEIGSSEKCDVSRTFPDLFLFLTNLSCIKENSPFVKLAQNKLPSKSDSRMFSDPIPIQHRPYTVQFFPLEINPSFNKCGKLSLSEQKNLRPRLLVQKDTNCLSFKREISTMTCRGV
jgi:hypothetical protein